MVNGWWRERGAGRVGYHHPFLTPSCRFADFSGGDPPGVGMSGKCLDGAVLHLPGGLDDGISQGRLCGAMEVEGLDLVGLGLAGLIGLGAGPVKWV